MTKLLAYHCKEEIKEKYKNRMLEHIKMDELIQGIAYENGKGCFVGCTLNNYQHSSFPNELGVPEELAHLSDAIFEGLSKKDAVQFSKDWHDQIKVGADLSMVWPQFALFILKDAEHGVLKFAQDKKFIQQKEAIENVINLYEQWLSFGIKPSSDKWAAAGATAWEAAWEAAGATAGATAGAAARAAARATAGAAARAAARAAAGAARAAGEAAGAARAAGEAAGEAHWLCMKEKFFELLRKAPLGDNKDLRG